MPGGANPKPYTITSAKGETCSVVDFSFSCGMLPQRTGIRGRAIVTYLSQKVRDQLEAAKKSRKSKNDKGRPRKTRKGTRRSRMGRRGRRAPRRPVGGRFGDNKDNDDDDKADEDVHKYLYGYNIPEDLLKRVRNSKPEDMLKRVRKSLGKPSWLEVSKGAHVSLMFPYLDDDGTNNPSTEIKVEEKSSGIRLHSTRKVGTGAINLSEKFSVTMVCRIDKLPVSGSRKASRKAVMPMMVLLRFAPSEQQSSSRYKHQASVLVNADGRIVAYDKEQKLESSGVDLTVCGESKSSTAFCGTATRGEETEQDRLTGSADAHEQVAGDAGCESWAVERHHGQH